MSDRSINLVTGGAGFLGSHLIETLMHAQEEVICLDNFLLVERKISQNGSIIKTLNFYITILLIRYILMLTGFGT